ncbi:hypothetical protein Tco_1548991 [Tanacetum coccineum]
MTKAQDQRSQSMKEQAYNVDRDKDHKSSTTKAISLISRRSVTMNSLRGRLLASNNESNTEVHKLLVSFLSFHVLNVDQLEKQLDKEEFQEIGSMASFKVLEKQFQMFIKSRIYLDDEFVVMTCNYFLQYTQLSIPEFRDTLIQHVESITEGKVGTGKALDASLVNTESNGTKSKEQDTSSRSRDDAHDDDADIRPLYDEEPMAEGIILAIANLFPNAEHRYCVKHIHENMKKRWNGNAYKELLWTAASTTTVPEFQKAMEKLKEFSKEAYEWLNPIPPQHWIDKITFSQGKSDVLLNNIHEVFNGKLVGGRDKLLLSTTRKSSNHRMDVLMLSGSRANKGTDRVLDLQVGKQQTKGRLQQLVETHQRDFFWEQYPSKVKSDDIQQDLIAYHDPFVGSLS